MISFYEANIVIFYLFCNSFDRFIEQKTSFLTEKEPVTNFFE